MSRALVVNLKIYYQSGWMWLIYLTAAAVSLPVILIPLTRRTAGEGEYFGYLIAAIYAGYITTTMQRETQVKRFTYCLPGHRYWMRRIVFSLGVALSAIWSLIFLTYPDLTAGKTLVVIVSAASLGLAVYLLVAFISSRFTNGTVLWAFPILLAVPDLRPLHRLAEDTIVFHPGWSFLLALVMSVWTWRAMEPDREARRICGTNYLAPHEALNSARVSHYNREQKRGRLRSSGSMLAGALGPLFADRRSKPSGDGVGTSVLDHCYMSLVRVLPSTNAWTLFAAAAVALFVLVSGFWPLLDAEGSPSKANLVFMWPVFLCGSMGAFLFMPWPIPIGRRERLWGVIAAGLLGAVLAVILNVYPLLVSKGIGALGAHLTILGREMSYTPVDEAYIYLTLIFLPGLYIGWILCHRWAEIFNAIVIVFVVILLHTSPQALDLTSSWFARLLLVSFWACYLWLVWRYCRRGDLAR